VYTNWESSFHWGKTKERNNEKGQRFVCGPALSITSAWAIPPRGCGAANFTLPLKLQEEADNSTQI